MPCWILLNLAESSMLPMKYIYAFALTIILLLFFQKFEGEEVQWDVGHSNHFTMGLGVPCTVQKSLTGVFSHTVWGRRATMKSGILGISSSWSDFLNIFSFTWRYWESDAEIVVKKEFHYLNLDKYDYDNIEFFFWRVSWIPKMVIQTLTSVDKIILKVNLFNITVTVH